VNRREALGELGLTLHATTMGFAMAWIMPAMQAFLEASGAPVVPVAEFWVWFAQGMTLLGVAALMNGCLMMSGRP
jgi:ABC-type amino acid transport system permease subunit